MPHGKKFLIVQILTGANDTVITNGTQYLRTRLTKVKNNTDVDSTLILRPKDDASDEWYTGPIAEVGETGIVYLRGHGNWQQRTLGGRPADDVVKLFANLPEGAIVNVVGCNTAVGAAADGDPLGDVSVNSFSGTLHLLLKAKRTTVIARSQPVQVNEDGTKVTYANRNLDIANPSMEDMLDKEKKRPGSKVEFYWQGDQQLHRNVY